MKHVKKVKEVLDGASLMLQTTSEVYLVMSKIVANPQLQDRVAVAVSNIIEEVTACVETLAENQDLMHNVNQIKELLEKRDSDIKNIFNSNNKQ